MDEIIQAIADAKVADTVATKVILSAAPTMTADQVSNSFAAAKIVTETKSSSGASNPVTASGGQPQSGTPVVQQSQQAGGTSGGSGSGTSFSGAPSSVGGGTGVSRT
ncbi:MAG: hypothetical protein IPJ18_16075 [Betaproteobacteria bacterium]|nr:hypothetical protein [Betaproteobacteria bacterium]